jgi:hypothetical protein
MAGWQPQTDFSFLIQFFKDFILDVHYAYCFTSLSVSAQVTGEILSLIVPGCCLSSFAMLLVPHC